MTKTNTESTILSALETLAAEQAALAAKVTALRTQLAKGTEDVTDAAAEAVRAVAPPPAVRPVPAPSLTERVEAALRRAPLTLEDLCREVRAPAGPVVAARKRLKTYNVGSEEHPRWTLVIGDDVSTAEAYAKIWQLIEVRPFESSELEEATGIRRGRVQGALVDVERLGGRKINAGGTAARKRHFMVKRPRDGIAAQVYGTATATRH